MNGLSVKNSTALTSSSILAVVSATSALSAKCMRGADSSRLEFGHSHRRRAAMARLFSRLALLALLAAPLVAQAQGTLTYRCTGADGKKYYGSTIPKPCYGRPLEQLNAHGPVVKRIEAASDPKERAANETAL